jgi:type II secretory pathway pseudopilin PulG
MTHVSDKRPGPSGASLIEVVIAMGVLAVSVPLMFGVFAKSGESAAAAKAETRCNWIIPECMREIEAAREGKARFLPRREAGAAYPASGETLALAFSGDGRPLGKVPTRSYEAGIKALADEPVRYLVSIHSELAENKDRPDVPPMLNLRLTLEYPAAVPVRKRRTLDFHSRIP